MYFQTSIYVTVLNCGLNVAFLFSSVLKGTIFNAGFGYMPREKQGKVITSLCDIFYTGHQSMIRYGTLPS